MFQTESFIARRLGIHGRSSGVMLRVATISVAISMTVMLIALAVVGGFRKEIGKQMEGFASPILITGMGGDRSYESLPIQYDEDFAEDIELIEGVEHVQRFASKGGILRGDSTIHGIWLKGIGPEFDTAFLHRQIVEGTIPLYNDTVLNRDVVISKTLSQKMRLGLGERFEALFVGEMSVKREWFRVAGIYHSGMGEFDRMLIIGDMGVVQRLNSWERDRISGYEIAVETAGTGTKRDVMRIEGVADEILDEVWTPRGDRLSVSTVRDRYPHIYDWLDMLNQNTATVIIIMMIVAIVNMISSVLIIVLEQTRTIGILKALGMGNGMLQRIFVLRTASVTGKGLLWGNAIGLGLCLLQYYTGAIALDADSYMISVVPMHLDWTWIAGLNILVFVLVTLMMTLPTLIISRITPDKAIRFQ